MSRSSKRKKKKRRKKGREGWGREEGRKGSDT